MDFKSEALLQLLNKSKFRNVLFSIYSQIFKKLGFSAPLNQTSGTLVWVSSN